MKKKIALIILGICSTVLCAAGLSAIGVEITVGAFRHCDANGNPVRW